MFDHFLKNTQDPQNLTTMGDVDAALQRAGHPWAFTLSLAVVFFFGAMMFWASFATIDVVIRGSGKVIPAEGVREIQSEKGGTISSIRVTEGQNVEPNEVVAVIDNIQDSSTLQDARNRSKELELSLIRLEAESNGTTLFFSDEIVRNYPIIVQSQIQIYEANMQRFGYEDSQLQEQIEQRKKEVEIALENKAETEQTLSLLQEEERAKKPLVGGAVSVIDYLQLQERVVTQEGELKSTIKSIERLQSAVLVAEQNFINRQNERKKFNAIEYNKNRVEMEEIAQRIASWSEQVSRAELRSPVRGTVNNILMKEGAVARGADVIMQIITRGESLELEVRFSPTDRGFLYIGQKGMAKFSSFDFSVYGGLEATITRISDDTVLDHRGDPWFEVRMITDKKSITYQGKEYSILPGMPLSVDLLANKKTIWQTIFGPIIKARQNAMTEH